MVATALRLDFGSTAVKESGLLPETILEIGSFGGYKIRMYFVHQRYRTAAFQWQGKALTCKFDRGPQNVTLM